MWTAARAQAFTDVTKQDYFYDAVNWAVEKEITSGVSKDVFAPIGTARAPTL